MQRIRTFIVCARSRIIYIYIHRVEGYVHFAKSVCSELNPITRACQTETKNTCTTTRRAQKCNFLCAERETNPKSCAFFFTLSSWVQFGFIYIVLQCSYIASLVGFGFLGWAASPVSYQRTALIWCCVVAQTFICNLISNIYTTYAKVCADHDGYIVITSLLGTLLQRHIRVHQTL